MAVILFVLGVIGKVLLAVVLLILLLLCMLLFVPVCYKVQLNHEEEWEIKGRVHALCGGFYVRFAYKEKTFTKVIRILGIPVEKLAAVLKKFKKKPVDKKRKSAKKKRAQEASTTKNVVEDVKYAKEQDEECTEKIEVVQNQVEDTMESHEQTSEKPEPSVEAKRVRKEKEDTGSEEEKLSWYAVLKERLQKIRLFFTSIGSVLGKIRKKLDWLSKAREVWRKENTQMMVCILKENVVHLIRILRPKKITGMVIFGTGDPAATGQILGVLAIFYAYYGKGVQVCPDFEEARLCGQLMIKGRICLISLLIIACKILFSKEWNRMKQDIEQLKEAF